MIELVFVVDLDYFVLVVCSHWASSACCICLLVRSLVHKIHTVQRSTNCGVAMNPSFTAKIMGLPRPANGAELRQFIASCNWVRGKILRFAQLMEPLQTLLTAALGKAKSRKSRAAVRVPLTKWSEMHEIPYENVKQAIVEAVKLAHPKPDYVMCCSRTHRPITGRAC